MYIYVSMNVVMYKGRNLEEAILRGWCLAEPANLEIDVRERNKLSVPSGKVGRHNTFHVSGLKAAMFQWIPATDS
jgi:hypothetical protein